MTADVAFLLAFSSLFSIINPIGGALIFYGFTKDFSPDDTEKIAARVGFYSLLIMFGALWAGAFVLHFFGVSIDALRIAGGTVDRAQRLAAADLGERSTPTGRTTSGKSAAAEDVRRSDADSRSFPLTLPFTTGPGTIAVAITIGAERPSIGVGLVAFFLGVSIAAVANAAIIWIAYRFADRLTNFMSATARR